MKDKSKQPDSLTPAPDTGREFAARRKIVKGMASAVPVVMTLGCGQAMAQASTMRCIVEPSPMPDHCINQSKTENPEYAREDATQTECKDTDPNAVGSNSDPAANKRRLVYVDSNGDPTTSTMGLPVTASCYASFIIISTADTSFEAFGN
jgi:hypothetical protein